MKDPIVKNNTTVVFGPVRLSHVHLLEKFAFDDNESAAKYSCVPLIPKSEKKTLQAIRQAIDAAYAQGVTSKWHGKKPPFDNYPPLADGDSLNKNGEERGPECKDHYFLNAKSTRKPQVVDRAFNPITDTESVYSGMWAMVSVSFYPYDTNGRGVACALNNVMKIRDDEPFGGGTTAASDFGDYNFSDDDDDDL